MPSYELRKWVWCMTAEVAMGEWVPAGATVEAIPQASPQVDLPEVSDGNWVTSSYDLLDGIRMVEGTDSIPDPLLDELFGSKGPSPGPQGE